MLKVACHQPNFVPWMPFFYKMAKSDIFILLAGVQFEKNGYQNRFKYKDKWITKPVANKTELIYDKHYADGESLIALNLGWIYCIKRTLGIETSICLDIKEGKPFCAMDNPTDRLVELVKRHKGTHYITNPTAKDKYLEEYKFANKNIEIEYCKVPKHLNKSMFEMFEEYGIEGTRKQLGV